MIAPMKKVYLVMREADRLLGLEELRSFGLVHLETGRPSGENWERASGELEAVSKAINIVPPNKKGGEARLAPEAAVARARQILEMEGRNAAIYEELGRVEKELERCRPWGDYRPQALAALAAEGFFLRLYSCDASALASLPEEVEWVELSRVKKALRIATIGRAAPAPDLPTSFLEFLSPEESPAELGQRRAALLSEVAAIKAHLASASADLPSLKRAAVWLGERIAFETARVSFETEAGLCAIKGFIPASHAASLAAEAKARGWALLMDNPGAEDATPTKVENNRVVDMIKPVFGFLGIVPAYTEYEISPWFLVFFSLFTAMIFGDGGYGGLMFLVWAFAAFRTWRKGQKLSDALRLFFLIAVLTLGWGALTGTWFSLRAESLPAFLAKLALWPISSANPGASKNIQILCFFLGALQLTVARIKNVIRDFPNPKFLAQVGSLALIGGMLFLVLNLVVDSKRFPVPPYAVWLVAGGFGATLLFGAYEGNILKSLVEGLKNIIPTFLGAVGVFADIVSYIRLWALGLAGSSLAAIINTMGGGLVKAALIGVFGIIILVFGHGLNMVLSVLSVVVHAIRLNILEFSCNHLGMQWSGIAYEPFRSTYKDKA